MNYIPLHHKYRPQTFTQLVGQDAIATTLSNALQQNRIAPAYLFTGARGTGKTSSARIFAKSLNCIAGNTSTPTPCGVCETCRTIKNGSNLDVIEIDAASNTGVDNIRELIERSQFAPVQCRYKVYVVDEVHMLSNAAFNALLKTLEEPPERVVFVLATTDPQRVLPTIISRCQRFDFRRIPLDDMVKHLGAIAQKEAIAIADDALYLVAQISQGGLRDAESLLDQLSLLVGEITVDRVWDLVGAVPERDLMSLLEAIASDTPETVLDTTRRLMDRGREPLIVLQNLASFYRDLLIAKTAPDRGDLVALTAPAWQALCQFATALDVKAILAGQKHLKDSEVQLKHSTQPRLWLEVTLMGLLPSAVPVGAAAAPSMPARSTPKSVALPQPAESSKAAIASQPPSASPEPAQPEPEPESAQPDQNGDLADLWQQILQKIQPFGTQTLLRQQGNLLDFQDQVAEISINSDKLLQMAQSKLPNIQAAFKQVTGQEVRVSLVVAAHPVAAPPAPAKPTEPPAPPAPTLEYKTETPPEPSVAEPKSQLLPETYTTEFSSTWDEDEVSRAARRLAEAFNGAIVDLDAAIDTPVVPLADELPTIDLPEPDSAEDEPTEDEEDVPF